MKQKSAYRMELEAEAKSLIASANAKLLNLEKLADKEGYEGIEQFAYRNAQQAIKSVRGEGYKRFNIPTNTHQLEKVIRSAKKFLDAPTSTKAGITSLYEKNAAQLNEMFGTNYSWQDMSKFLEAAKWDDLKNAFDSKTAVLVIKGLYAHKDLNRDEIDLMLKNHQVNFSDDEVDNDVINTFVSTNIDWDELF